MIMQAKLFKITALGQNHLHLWSIKKYAVVADFLSSSYFLDTTYTPLHVHPIAFPTDL